MGPIPIRDLLKAHLTTSAGNIPDPDHTFVHLRVGSRLGNDHWIGVTALKAHRRPTVSQRKCSYLPYILVTSCSLLCEVIVEQVDLVAVRRRVSSTRIIVVQIIIPAFLSRLNDVLKAKPDLCGGAIPAVLGNTIQLHVSTCGTIVINNAHIITGRKRLALRYKRGVIKD
jgi:hypothetical protein